MDKEETVQGGSGEKPGDLGGEDQEFTKKGVTPGSVGGGMGTTLAGGRRLGGECRTFKKRRRK